MIAFFALLLYDMLRVNISANSQAIFLFEKALSRRTIYETKN